MTKEDVRGGPTPHDLVKAEIERDSVGSVTRVQQLFSLQDPGYVGQLSTRARDNSKIVPLVIGSHQSHADGVGASLITMQFDKDFQMVLSDTALSGGQSKELGEVIGHALPGLSAHGIVDVVGVITDGDIEKGRADLKINKRAIAQLLTGVRRGQGIVLWPDGTLAHGREAKAGVKDYEPALPDPTIVIALARRMIEKGFEPWGVHYAVDGSWGILDPDDLLITDEAGKRFFQEGTPEPLADIWVGGLITPEEFSNAEDDYFIMERITETLREGRAAAAA